MKRKRPRARRIRVDEALDLAIRHHREGRLDVAESIYQRVLEASPDHARALHYAGVLAHHRGRSEEGAARILRSLELAPDQPDAFSNLGIIYKEMGRLEDATRAFQEAIRLRPDHTGAHNNLGVALKAQGRLEEAEEAYRRGLDADPAHVDARYNLGVLLAERGRTREAVVCFCQAITHDPGHREAPRSLALAHATLGEIDEAVQVLEAWVRKDPGNPVALHMLAACSGRDVPERASDAFVENVFDRFAESFDESLEKLRYRAPQILAALLEDAGFRPTRDLDVLDAGCGTGLCGPLVAPCARTLIGVDLSSGMLDRARERNVYDRLEQGELTAYLLAHPDAFDLVVCADTLVYFGALEDVARAAAGALRPGGTFAFTVEAAAGATYTLLPHGRYAHARGYVEEVTRAAGFAPTTTEVELRLEAGVPVAGYAVRAVRGT